MTNIPRIIVAGTQSGVGKTSVSLALMAAFKKAGRRVQSFKVGPDYIDPSYHAVATGVPSHNLDSYLLSYETVRQLFAEKSGTAELSIIEGAMGLFDGLGEEETGSTAQIAKFLQAPVILVIDAKGLSRSAAAMIHGYKTFDPDLKISGVILNKVGSAKHFQTLKEVIESNVQVPVIGVLFRDARIQIPERHLGLMTASENKEWKNVLNLLSGLGKGDPAMGQSGLDLEKIFQIASSAPALSSNGFTSMFADQNEKKCRIAYALDAAFNFYYQANLDLLHTFGAELVPFSPIGDESVPECDVLYFGGGFPEIYARELEENARLRDQIKNRIGAGLPIYAECGGLMYLSESIETLDGKSYSMAGAIPGKIMMTQKLQNFGYKQGTILRENILGQKDVPVRGHEFHYSQRISQQDRETIAYQLMGRDGKNQSEGFVKDSLLASYLHLHFLTNPDWAKRLVWSAKKYHAKKEVAQR